MEFCRHELKEFEIRARPVVPPCVRFYGDSRAEEIRRYKQKRVSLGSAKTNPVLSGKKPEIPSTDYTTSKNVFTAMTDDGRFTL